ncbi:MAG: sulfatase-like hydrolase/transferase [Desulfamplus sp.]|nr:sulfatase-like hydrolase/transferase [Desulfamplus sp.]
MPYTHLAVTGGISPSLFFIKLGIVALSVWAMVNLWLEAFKREKKIVHVPVFALFQFFVVSAWIEAGLMHFTGKSFSREFFYHLNPDALAFGLGAYSGYAWYLVLSMAISSLILRHIALKIKKEPHFFPGYRSYKNRVFLLIPALVLSFPFTPLWGLGREAAHYYFKHDVAITPTHHDVSVLSNLGMNLISLGKSDIETLMPPKHRNLVLIFLESMNFNFVNHPYFPGLTPWLDHYSKRFTLLGNHISTENATMPAIISSLCGIIPEYSRGNDTIALQGNMYKNLACFTDILANAGYRQVYMGGARLSFAGKGEFLLEHGYHEVMGWEQWKRKEHYQQDENHSYWGLHDYDLFHEAAIKVAELKKKAPFHLTLLTLNTHVPGFFSHKCEGYPYPHDNGMLDAIYCMDAALGKFLVQLEEDGFFEDTVIAVVGDHKMFNHENTRSILSERERNHDNIGDGRIFGMIHSPDHDLPGVIEVPTAPCDLAPTLPDLLGVEHNIRFSVGISLLEPIKQDRFILDRDNSNNAHPGCDPSTIALPQAPPYSPCEHRRILSILDANLGYFHEKEDSFFNMLNHVVMRSSIQGVRKASIFMGGQEQLQRLSRDGVTQDRDIEGFYCVVLNEGGGIAARRAYGVHNVSEMRDFISLLTDMERGQWLFLVHRGDVMARLPRTALYLLKKMGWPPSFDNLPGSNTIFVTRKGIDPRAAVFHTVHGKDDLEITLSLTDFHKMLAHSFSSAGKQESHMGEDIQEDIQEDPDFILSVIEDEEILGVDGDNDITICGFGGGDSSISLFSDRKELVRGMNVMAYSYFMQKFEAGFVYDFHDPDVDVHNLLTILTSDLSQWDYTIVVAVHDDARFNLPGTIIKALKDIGAEKIDQLEVRAPYLFIFHTRHGVIHEALGESGSCISEDGRYIIRKILEK